MKTSSTLKFWTMFLQFLLPGANDPDPPEDTAADDAPDADPPEPSDPDPELRDDDPPAPAPTARPAPSSTDELVAMREQNRALAAALETVSGANRRPAQADENQRTLEDPNATPEQKWQAQANIALRQGYSTSQQALQLARDAADASSFQLKCVTDPMARKYSADVEKKRLELIAKNGTAPERDAILTWVIGEKVRNRAASAPASKDKAGSRSSTSTAPRGSTPNARSDVSSRGKTDSEKRRARLENVNI